MKLWIKLAITLFIITNIIIELVLFIVTPEVKEHHLSLLGEKLKSTAAAAAVAINGDEFKKLNFSDSLVHNKPDFIHIKNQLKKTQTALGLKEDIYTLSSVNAEAAVFGITTNPTSYTGDTLHFISSIAKEAFTKAYKKNECIYTELYTDQYGTWISGLAPILDNNDNAVGVVQVDNSYDTVQAMLSYIDKSILWVQIVFIPITILFSILIARYFTKPIKVLTEKINKLSLGDYSENPKFKSRGELRKFNDAAENLRTTILQQQEKIFQNIKELEKARDKAVASDRLKSEFLAVISHEIRTPLNIILGNVEVLKLELDEDKITELDDILESIKFGSTRLIRTVEMLVLYSELSAESYVKRENYVDVNELFFSTVERYKKTAVEKGLKINFDCATTTGMIKADERLLEEAINQLADNAVKYTKNGEIVFCIRKTDDDKIKLIFNDTGIGISNEFMKELYKPFRQEDMSYERSFEGNGIGLALTKKCCDFNGFELQITSEKNKGTTAEIIIPKKYLFNEG